MSTSSYNIINNLRRLVSALHIASRQTEKQLGISAAQLFALQKLQDGQTRSLNELAQLTHTHQSSLSVVVQKLVDKGFLRRDVAPDDSRRLLLSIAGKGERLLARAEVSVGDRLLGALQAMPEVDREHLDRLLGQLLEQAAMQGTEPRLFFEYDDPHREESNERSKTTRAMQQQGSRGARQH